MCRRRPWTLAGAVALLAPQALLLAACLTEQAVVDPPGTEHAARAYGEPVGSFPTWAERTLIVLTNRARADPVSELVSCTTCADKGCFTSPLQPMQWLLALNRSARFHAANLTHTGCSMSHASPCALVADIDTVYDVSCDGEASCACQGGVTCGGGTTTWDRLGLFGAASGARAENIAGAGDPWIIFYQWLFEETADPTCTWTVENGHRWNILGGYNKIGAGAQGSYSVQDFWLSGSLTQKVLAGAHYPATGPDLLFRANWYDTAGPSLALVNVGGTCTVLYRERGLTDANATYFAAAMGIAGCTRYYFIFEDSNGQRVTYPDTGSFGIGCPTDWDISRPSEGAGCVCTPDCSTSDCGHDGCGGSCGECVPPAVCLSGHCVCTPDCSVNECGPDGCGGSCGDCALPETCQAGLCVCSPDCSVNECGPDGCGGSCGDCGPSEVCQAGQCLTSCTGGLTPCEGHCVDLLTDETHCGTCNHPCATNEECQSGSCVCVPDCQDKDCGPDGCTGICGTCSGTDTCQAGQCVCTLQCAGKVCGPNGCQGVCGSCAWYEACQAGQCVSDCDPALTQCGADCVDIQTDEAHCGGCYDPCELDEVCLSGGCTTAPADAGVPDGGASDGGVTDGGSGDGGNTDASPDAFVPRDSGPGADTGPGDPGEGKPGCSCESGPSEGGSLWLALLLLAPLVRLRSARRQARRTAPSTKPKDEARSS